MNQEIEKTDIKKRQQIIKTLAVGGLAVTAWHKPIINSVILPAHAQTTGSGGSSSGDGVQTKRVNGYTVTGPYVNGLRHGDFTISAPGGFVTFEGRYTAGARTGTWTVTARQRDGSIQFIDRGSYNENNQKHGVWTRNPSIYGWMRGPFVDGLAHGRFEGNNNIGDFVATYSNGRGTGCTDGGDLDFTCHSGSPWGGSLFGVLDYTGGDVPSAED